MEVLRIHYFQQRSHCFWTWKTFKKHVFLQLANVQQLLSTTGKSPYYIQFRAKFDADTLFFQVCHFLGTKRSQMEHNIGTFNKTLLNSYTCYSLIPSRKWHISFYSNLHLAVEVGASSCSVVFFSVHKLFHCTVSVQWPYTPFWYYGTYIQIKFLNVILLRKPTTKMHSTCLLVIRGWPKKFLASTIDGNNIGKIFFS